MYKAPDFVKVSTKMKDVFAGYGCDYERGQYSTRGSQTCTETGPWSTWIVEEPGNCGIDNIA